MTEKDKATIGDSGIDPRGVDEIVAETGSDQRHLIPILQAIQKKYNYLPPECLERLAEITEITPSAITGVSTFFGQFRHKPAGRHFVKVCIGTACHVKGAENVADAFARHLEIEPGEDTDKDRIFTLQKVACLGCCMLAPAVQIDDITYGPVETTGVGRVLADFLEAQKAGERTARLIAEGARLVGEVRVCLCSSCVAGGTKEIFEELQSQIEELGIPVALKNVGCTGISYQTPMVSVVADGSGPFHYGQVKVADVRAILLRHFRPAGAGRKLQQAVNGLLERLLTDETWEPVTRYSMNLRQGPDSDYFGTQMHLATENCGEVDPLDLDEYLRRGGFSALEKCLREMTPEQVVETITESGLRGRGGAGFPTGIKWASVAGEAGDRKYVVCNGDEGDPGAFMDRMILESFPFRVLEGMAIAAYSAGAEEGFLYIRAEYPFATKRVRRAIEMCEERGYLGKNIMDSGFSARFEVQEGAGAFVCGEETALIKALEGRRGMPVFRPPYPAQSGLWGYPTLVNNTETLALVSWIIRHGVEEFRKLGTENSKGSKAFALAGKVVRGGLIEVPMGITIRDVVERVGGGIADGRRFKAVQVGGPSGGCLPASLADTAIDYDALISHGAMMGSGGMVALDDADCMVDIARYFLAFTQLESCGKCTFCRVGTKRMLEILDRLCEGNGKSGDIEDLESLAAHIKAGSLCGLGRTAPNPVLSTIRYFREEYEAHIEGRCPALKCKTLVKYVVTDKCIGCTKCAQVCPVAAIEPNPFEEHEIDVELCTRCDACRQVCPVEAIEIRNIKDDETGKEG